MLFYYQTRIQTNCFRCFRNTNTTYLEKSINMSKNIINKGIIGLIRIYQTVLSPDTGLPKTWIGSKTSMCLLPYLF